jgi:hypothetical protein
MKNLKHTIHYALIAALLLFASACSKDDNQGPTLTAKQLTREQRLDSIIHSKTGLNPTIMFDSVEVMGTFGIKVIDTSFKTDFDTIIFGYDPYTLWFPCKVGELEPQNPNRDKYAMFFLIVRSISIQINDSNGLIGEHRNDTMLTMNFSEYRIASRFFDTEDDLDYACRHAHDKKNQYYKELKHSYDSMWNVFEVHNIPYPLSHVKATDDPNYVYSPIEYANWGLYDLDYFNTGGLMKYAFKAGGGHGDDFPKTSSNSNSLQPSKIKEFNVKMELLSDGKLHKVLYLAWPFFDNDLEVRYLRLRYVLN